MARPYPAGGARPASNPWLMGGRSITAILASLLTLAPILGSAETLEPYVVCAHVPTTGAAPIPHHPDRFGQFYFDAVNAEQGGIDGHPVEFIAYNDNYNPAGARDALEKCSEKEPILYVGLAGTDQIVSAARWAEQRQVPYLHAQAPRLDLEELSWSAWLGPTDEHLMRGLAATFMTAPSPRIGVIRVNSPYYDAGSSAFREAVEEQGGEVLVNIPVQKDESNFQNVFIQLQRSRITHVNLHATATIALKMFNQKPSTFNPTWGTIDLLTGSNIVAQAAHGAGAPMVALHDLSPAYDRHDDSLPWASEIEEFHRVFDVYSPEKDPPRDDFDWMAYLRAKQIHRFLDSLDGDVTSDSIRAAFSSYSETDEEAYPSCSLDFEATPRIGAHDWHIFTSDDGSWQQPETCGFATSLSDLDPVDPFGPAIDCGQRSQVVTDPVACTIVDPDGIASFDVVDEGVPLGGTAVEGTLIGCPMSHDFELDLTPGYHEIAVTATDCDDLSNTRSYEIVSLHI